MRVLFLSDLWPPFPGGAERLMFNLGRDLMRRGHEVSVLTGYEDARQFDGPRLTIRNDLDVFDGRDKGGAVTAAFLAATTPDVVISHHLYANQFEPELVSSGVPLIHVVLNGQRISGAKLAIYISEWIRERAHPEDYDLTITPPVFDDIIAETTGDCIGFIKPITHKGVDLFYKVAEWFPDRKFLVLRGEWQDLEIIEPAANIEFVEPVDDMRDFYCRCRMLLMPSRSEDAGTVAQEATLNNLPCISTDVGGLTETNGGGIRLVPDDVLAFVAVIRSLDDPDLYDAVVQRQSEHLEASDQSKRLDLFAEGVEAVVSGEPFSWVPVEEEEVDGD